MQEYVSREKVIKAIQYKCGERGGERGENIEDGFFQFFQLDGYCIRRPYVIINLCRQIISDGDYIVTHECGKKEIMKEAEFNKFYRQRNANGTRNKNKATARPTN